MVLFLGRRLLVWMVLFGTTLLWTTSDILHRLIFRTFKWLVLVCLILWLLFTWPTSCLISWLVSSDLTSKMILMRYWVVSLSLLSGIVVSWYLEVCWLLFLRLDICILRILVFSTLIFGFWLCQCRWGRWFCRRCCTRSMITYWPVCIWRYRLVCWRIWLLWEP